MNWLVGSGSRLIRIGLLGLTLGDALGLLLTTEQSDGYADDDRREEDEVAEEVNRAEEGHREANARLHRPCAHTGRGARVERSGRKKRVRRAEGERRDRPSWVMMHVVLVMALREHDSAVVVPL